MKQASAGSAVQRVYKEFNSLGEFEVAAMQSVAELRRFLDGQMRRRSAGVRPSRSSIDGIPRPPALYAEPRYIGSHEFVGRAAELATLSRLGRAADPHPVLLFEAIGGTGKSMLTWEWTANHATAARGDWAGPLLVLLLREGRDHGRLLPPRPRLHDRPAAGASARCGIPS